MKNTSFCLLFRFLLLLLFASAGLIPLPPVVAQQNNSVGEAGTYYVSTQGNDNNPGTRAQPWQTIHFAVNQAAPGDIILVEDGTYQGSVIMTRSGSPGAYITLKAINSLKAKIEVVDGLGKTDGIKAAANYLTIDGFEIYDAAPGIGHHGNGITVYENHHVNILNNKIHDFGGSGIQTGHFDHVHIENNIVHDNAKYNPQQSSGISLWQARAVDDAPGYHVIVRNNRSYGNINSILNPNGVTTDGNGIFTDDFWNSTGDATNIIFPHRTLLENNLCYDNGGKGIQVFKSNHVDLFNNTAFHNNRDEQSIATWRAELGHAFADDTVWRNNIGVAKPGTGILRWNRGILIGKDGHTVWENNISYNGTPGDLSILLDNASVTEAYLLAHNLLGVNPLFTDEFSQDFSLTPESPAIDAGSDQIFSFIDIDYKPRPQGAVDIGAFEFADSSLSVGLNPYDEVVADAYHLGQSYPNPFNSHTRIQYTLPVESFVLLEVFDLLGRNIRTLVSENQAAGTYSVFFDARDLSNGAYMYRLTARAFKDTKAMVLLR